MTIRLSAEESAQLDAMTQSNVTGCDSRSDLVRLLLAREWNRRKGLGKPPAKQWQGAWRNGRPKIARQAKLINAPQASQSVCMGVPLPDYEARMPNSETQSQPLTTPAACENGIVNEETLAVSTLDNGNNCPVPQA